MLQRRDIPIEPSSNLLLADFASRKRKDRLIRILLAGCDSDCVYIEKCERNYKRGALVSVDKGMIGGNPKGVGRCKPGKRWRRIRVGPQIARAHDCGLQHAGVS